MHTTTREGPMTDDLTQPEADADLPTADPPTEPPAPSECGITTAAGPESGPATTAVAPAPTEDAPPTGTRTRPRWLVPVAVAVGIVLLAVATGFAVALIGAGRRDAGPRAEWSSALPPTAPGAAATVTPGAAGTGTPEASPATPDSTNAAVAATSVPSPDLRSAVTVLMYHHVMPVPNNNIAISPELFDRQMRYLRDNGFHPITMAQMQAFVLHGRVLPSRPVLITFDDGRLNQLTYAVPILRSYGFPATFFIVGDWAMSPDRSLMHPAQLRQFVANGFDLESHTMNHWLMNRKHGESYARLKAREWQAVYGMRGWLESTVRAPGVRALAYPGGYFDPFAMRLAEEAGYELAFTTQPGYVSYRAQDQYALPRFNAGARGLRFGTFVRIVMDSLKAAPASRTSTPVVVP